MNDIQAQVKQQVQLPAGYYIQYAGQFEAEARAAIAVQQGASIVSGVQGQSIQRVEPRPGLA